MPSNSRPAAMSSPHPYISRGQMLSRPPMMAQIRLFFYNIYLLIGLFITTLFSLDAAARVQNSRFNPHNRYRQRRSIGSAGSGSSSSGSSSSSSSSSNNAGGGSGLVGTGRAGRTLGGGDEGGSSGSGGRPGGWGSGWSWGSGWGWGSGSGGQARRRQPPSSGGPGAGRRLGTVDDIRGPECRSCG